MEYGDNGNRIRQGKIPKAMCCNHPGFGTNTPCGTPGCGFDCYPCMKRQTTTLQRGGLGTNKKEYPNRSCNGADYLGGQCCMGGSYWNGTTYIPCSSLICPLCNGAPGCHIGIGCGSSGPPRKEHLKPGWGTKRRGGRTRPTPRGRAMARGGSTRLRGKNIRKFHEGGGPHAHPHGTPPDPGPPDPRRRRPHQADLWSDSLQRKRYNPVPPPGSATSAMPTVYCNVECDNGWSDTFDCGYYGDGTAAHCFDPLSAANQGYASCSVGTCSGGDAFNWTGIVAYLCGVNDMQNPCGGVAGIAYTSTSGGNEGLHQNICFETCGYDYNNMCGGGCEQGYTVWCDCCDGVPYPGTNSGISC